MSHLRAEQKPTCNKAGGSLQIAIHKIVRYDGNGAKISSQKYEKHIIVQTCEQIESIDGSTPN
jgi:hypothetical protein